MTSLEIGGPLIELHLCHIFSQQAQYLQMIYVFRKLPSIWFNDADVVVRQRSTKDSDVIKLVGIEVCRTFGSNNG